MGGKGGRITHEKAIKASSLVREYGADRAAEILGIARETVRRYSRMAKAAREESQPSFDPKFIRQLQEKYSQDELKKILSGSECRQESRAISHSFSGDAVTVGLLSDTHLGSIYTDPDCVARAFDVFVDRGVDMVCHCGDVCEGMSGRPGHVYELTHIGYHAQREHAIDVLRQWTDTPMYLVSGNHDRWYSQDSGAHIVRDICAAIPNAEFIGDDEGDVVLRPKGNKKPTTIKLWHGGDGSSYAVSYRVQKIIESLTGGEKPNALFCGHTHKSMYLFDRHVHCVSAGAVQRQSKWMRGKRLASHTGFWVVEMTVNDGVSSIRPEWFPYYI